MYYYIKACFSRELPFIYMFQSALLFEITRLSLWLYVSMVPVILLYNVIKS